LSGGEIGGGSMESILIVIIKGFRGGRKIEKGEGLVLDVI